MSLPKNILVIGSGGREHTLVRSLLRSKHAPKVSCAPGNAGIALEAPCFPIAVEAIEEICELAEKKGFDFVVVGPEVPLSLGLVDALALRGISAFGPKAEGSRLEASKVYTKEILQKCGIPTAASGVFSEVNAALDYLRSRQTPIVIKADGLAAGKGVVVAQTLEEAETAIRSMIEGARFGASGKKILIEDCLYGEETSLLVVVSGKDYVILPTSQDHKRIGEGDTGPNTGGMGTYSPAEVVTEELLKQIEESIVRPSVRAILKEGIDFRGILFIGIMLTAEGPMVLEYNTRFGDPETQVVLPRIESDILELLWSASTGALAEYNLRVKSNHCVCVVVAAKGYPDTFSKGESIGLPPNTPEGVAIFHAGTGRNDKGELVSAGGRVLGVTAEAPTLIAARQLAYETCESIRYANKYYRRDIAARQLNRQ